MIDRETLEKTGWASLLLSGDVNEDTKVLNQIIEELGRPLHVYRNHPFWKPFEVDPYRPPGRSGGIGLNSLHIDCVNMESPPDFVILYCSQPDPLGGGESLVCSTAQAVPLLSNSARRILAEERYAEGTSYDLDGVGPPLEIFAIIDDKIGMLRYTGRLLDSDLADNARDAVLELDRILMLRAESFMLRCGEALIIDQRRAVHGRLPLGNGQSDLPVADRRRLTQAFVREIRE